MISGLYPYNKWRKGEMLCRGALFTLVVVNRWSYDVHVSFSSRPSVPL